MLPTHAANLTGTVRSVEALPEGRRITLEAVLVDGETLQRWLRIRLKKGDEQAIATGDTVRLRALVRSPMPPAYPGAWDLQRDAWYSGQGGSGYALGPVERIAETPPSGPLRVVQRLREFIAQRISMVVPGAAGAVSITLLTGVTAGIPASDHDAFRASGLAHLLAVAGLHIGIVMGWTLAFARLVLAASEHASLHWPAKKLAALTALLAGGGYMVLTGMPVSTNDVTPQRPLDANREGEIVVRCSSLSDWPAVQDCFETGLLEPPPSNLPESFGRAWPTRLIAARGFWVEPSSH